MGELIFGEAYIWDFMVFHNLVCSDVVCWAGLHTTSEQACKVMKLHKIPNILLSMIIISFGQENRNLISSNRTSLD